jgi:hypothetical protein
VFRFQYTIVTKAARKLAWEVFSDHRCWNSFANIYGEIRWREGRPWQAGSRLEIELVHPFRGVIEHVLTSCTLPATGLAGLTMPWAQPWPSGCILKSTSP